MIRRPPRSTLFSLHDALPISGVMVMSDVVQHEVLAHMVTEAVKAKSKRSEEHTSELQSPCNLVCRPLLEKKSRHVWSCSDLTSSELVLPAQTSRSPLPGTLII